MNQPIKDVLARGGKLFKIGIDIKYLGHLLRVCKK